jgi:RNA polymerase sigma-70 factor, ECF subfamily
MTPKGITDGTSQLVDPARVEEFIALLGLHQRRIRLFVMSLIPKPSDAEDVVQETHLVLWREFGQYESGTNFAAWSCTVAFHQVLAWRKRQQRDRLVFRDEFLEAVSREFIAQESRLEERTLALNACIEKVPHHHRDLLKLRYTDGQPIDAIARKLNRNTDAVYRMLSRIRQALQECVGQQLNRQFDPRETS